MPRILVTGGLGFIGSHLIQLLLRDPEAEIVALDNLCAKTLPIEDTVRQIATDMPGELSVRIESIQEFHTRSKFDRIYHLASVVGPARVIRHAGFISEKIVSDTYRVIRLAMEHGARLVNVSTSEIYGGGKNGYCDEGTPKLIVGRSSGRLEYAAAKLAAEVSLENLCQLGTLDAVTVRPFNVTGTRQGGGGGFVLPRFVGQAILEQPLTVFGDGRQVRAFTDARDVARGILLVAERGECGTAYNVGNPQNRITIDQLADNVLNVTRSNSPKVYVDPTTIYGNGYREAADKFPNADRILALGWEPQYGVMDTIDSVYRFMRVLSAVDLVRIAGVEVRRIVASSDQYCGREIESTTCRKLTNATALESLCDSGTNFRSC